MRPLPGERRFAKARSWPLSVGFFPAAVLYQELLLRAFDRDTAFFGPALIRILLFSAAGGLLIFLILDLLPWRRAARIAGGAVIGLGTVLFCVERACRATFGIYYGVLFIGGIVGKLIVSFGDAVAWAALEMLPFILLSLVPIPIGTVIA